eukprot:3390253-Alexandrium_andersonii.AAC.1
MCVLAPRCSWSRFFKVSRMLSCRRMAALARRTMVPLRVQGCTAELSRGLPVPAGRPRRTARRAQAAKGSHSKLRISHPVLLPGRRC